jgi:short-subunit dehydrogenase
MPESMAVFGAGPGLGQAIARRYAQAGYTVTLVARRQPPLQALAAELAATGATVHVIPADLADTQAVPPLAQRIRDAAGDPSVLYYGVCAGGFVPASALTPEHARSFLPLSLYSLVAAVQAFLPAMTKRGRGAILSAQGASAIRGTPYLSGPGPALAAQRNYLQSLAAEVASQGVYVGALYIGAAIKNTPFHAQREADRAAGKNVGDFPDVDPEHLAELLWTMHSTKAPAEASYPAHSLA